MPEADLALLIAAAKIAGKIALSHWKASPQVWEKPEGQGPVSAADLEVNEALAGFLQAARPTYGWLSEETPDSVARLSTQAQFILDPIDGTRSFLQGDSAFSHALAVVQNGQVTAGVVYLPAMDKLYAATAQGAATLNGVDIRASAPKAEPRVLTSKSTLAPDHWPGGVPVLHRHFRAGMAWRLCLVAEGAFDAMLTTARIFGEELNGLLVDDNRNALSDAALAAIRKQLEGILVKMQAGRIEAGGARALRLFG